jgi:prepilin-type N-terminal cleavage/methylation domain-containing protein
MVKKAFTLIELILAIVIIGVVFIGVPALMQSNSKALESSIKQENVYQITTKLWQIISYRWDENSNLNVLNVANGDSKLDRTSADSSYGQGHLSLPKHRKFESNTSLYASASLGNDTGETNEGLYDDIDDFKTSTAISVLESNVKSAYGYKTDAPDVTINVSYISDTFSVASSIATFDFSTTSVANSTNIKMVEVNSTNIKLRAYSSNIGQCVGGSNCEILARTMP